MDEFILELNTETETMHTIYLYNIEYTILFTSYAIVGWMDASYASTLLASACLGLHMA